MQVLIAVVYDLFQFVCKGFSGAIPYAPQQLQLLDTYQEKLQKIQGTTTAVPALSSPVVTYDVQDENILRIGDQYFIGDIGTYLYHDPVQAFDNALKRLEYGQHVRLVSVQGRWAHVRFDDVTGWVFKDALVMQSDEVYPRFMSEIQYGSSHPETIKLRACIDDLFGGARGEHSLSAAEYVHYQLCKKKRSVEWGDTRMRIPGTWQRKLRGQTGIHISITPKTESVMEYVTEDVGHLAFVEAVFPDGSMKISEVGKADDAAYTEEILSPEQWRELRPVFIEIE